LSKPFISDQEEHIVDGNVMLSQSQYAQSLRVKRYQLKNSSNALDRHHLTGSS